MFHSVNWLVKLMWFTKKWSLSILFWFPHSWVFANPVDIVVIVSFLISRVRRAIIRSMGTINLRNILRTTLINNSTPPPYQASCNTIKSVLRLLDLAPTSSCSYIVTVHCSDTIKLRLFRVEIYFFFFFSFPDQPLSDLSTTLIKLVLSNDRNCHE